MNSPLFKFAVFVVMALSSNGALAEVSDKFASIPALLLHGLVASIVGFFLGRWRAWLAVIGIAVGILLFSGISLLWHDS